MKSSATRFRKQIAEGRVCVGTGVTLSDPAVSELFAEMGFDFVWIDMEHGPLDLRTVLGHIMAFRGSDTAPIVRVPCNDENVIKPILDLAPAGIIVPMVNSPEEAAAAVRASRYPPIGTRGYGPRRGPRFGMIDMEDYLASSTNEPMVIIQIEHIDAVQRIDAIVATPGLDGICLGPNDLSGSMGKLGHPTDPNVVEQMDKVIHAVKQTELMLGVSTGYAPDHFTRWIEKGIQWINLNVDWLNLRNGSKEILHGARTILESL